ncbi:hypothetical protein TNCV_4242331 [Trichonephila clavipes]|nr:hypothetical protein TNCV_4242331 [Trichonephila clavipes]
MCKSKIERRKYQCPYSVRANRMSPVFGSPYSVIAVAYWSRSRTRGWRDVSSILEPLKTSRVGGRYTLNLSTAQMSSRWCRVEVRSGELAQVLSPSMVQNYVVRRQKTLE